MPPRPPRRATPNRTRPTHVPVRQDSVDPGETGLDQAEVNPEVEALQGAVNELLQDFEAMLVNDPGIDQETRDFVQKQFADALDEAAAESEPTAALDRGAWMDVVEGLQGSGAVTEDEANVLIRQLNQALRPLESRESQIAIEFGRRMQTEGQEKALAWFREQKSQASADPEQDASSGIRKDPPQPLRSEMVNSRSRRVRGPPKHA